MLIINGCVQDELLVEYNGVCSSVNEIVNSIPIFDCDEVKVCLGPYYVSLKNLLDAVYNYMVNFDNKMSNAFIFLRNQYDRLLAYFMECCAGLNAKLNNIEKRLNDLVVIREIIINNPPTPRPPRPPRPPVLPPRPPSPPVIENNFIIDKNLKYGYMDKYTELSQDGSLKVSPYVSWMMTEDGKRRNLIINEISKNDNVDAIYNEIKRIFNLYNLEINRNMLRFREKVDWITINRMPGKWRIEGNNIINEGGDKLIVPIYYGVKQGNFILDSIIGWKIKNGSSLRERVIFIHKIIDIKTGVVKLVEGDIYYWFNY